MKKMLYCVVAIAALMISASCQKENLEAEKTNVVSYTVEIPDVINTKAVGDGTGGVNELVYEVWRTDAADKDALVSANETRLYQNKKDITPSTGVVHIEFELVNDQNARILFWAQCKDNTVYNTANLKEVTLNCASTDNKLVSNQVEYAAFAGTDFIKDGDPLNGRTITLKRPVAQLNIATSAESLVLGDNSTSTVTNVSVSKSTVKVTGLSTTFNVAEMKAGSDNNTEFVFAESDLADISSYKVTVNSTDYTYVAMNYLAFAPAAGTNVKVDYTLVTDVGKITNTVNNVPVKPNYRTNIIGNLITSKTDYDITLNKDWTTPETTVESLTEGVIKNTDGSYMISTASGLAYASEMLFENGGTFYVSSNIDMNGMGITPATVPPGVTLTIIGDLQTRAADTTPITISGLSVNGKYAALIGEVAGTVIIKGIKIADSEFISDKSSGSAAAAFVANTTGSVTIEGCSVSGCEFEDASVAGGLVGNSTGSLSVSASDVNRCEFDEISNNNVGSLVGSATGDNIQIAKDNNAYFNNIVGGEDVSKAVGNKDDVDIDTTPDVDTDPTGVYEVSDAYSLAYAIEEAKPVDGQTAVNVKVIKDIAMTSSVTVPADRTVVLDLNGKTISHEMMQTAGYQMILNDGTLTIEDSLGGGKISYTDTGNGGEYISDAIYNRSVLIINGGTIENLSSATVAQNGYPHAVDTYSGIRNTSVTINGGTIYCAEYSAVRMFCVSATYKANLEINKGTVKGAIDMQNGTKDAAIGNLTINNGTFETTKNPNNIRFANWNGGATEYGLTASINDGKFNGGITTQYVPAAANWNKGIITGGTFETDPSVYVADGYTVELQNDYYVVVKAPGVAKIGEKEYYSLQEAVNEAEDDATIIILLDIKQTDGVKITDKRLTVDLNQKTFTVSDGANTNNRNFKIDGSSVVTIKNGTMVAAGEYSSGAYGTLRTEGTANVTLDNLKLYNYRGNGLNVKACNGTVVTVTNTEIYSEYGGGVEAAGGEVVLTNVKVEQKGMYTAPYNSMAISVNGGGRATVNSGTYSTECITAEEANGQGTTHGPWVAGVLNSGGTLIINGGTFSNDNFGDNSLATAARGLLLADTGANIEIKNGRFNALKDIIDIQNNLGDASKNPTATISGGVFSANPLTYDELISLADGYSVIQNNDNTWSVQANNAAAE